MEEGWHFLAAASLAQGRSDKALTDRHQMLFRAAPGLAHSFRFFPPSETRNAEPVHVTSPQPQAGVLGPGGARLLSSTQEACIEVGKGRRCTGTFHPTLLLNRPWKHWRRPFHTLEKDPVVIGHRVQDKIHNLSKSLGLSPPPPTHTL